MPEQGRDEGKMLERIKAGALVVIAISMAYGVFTLQGIRSDISDIKSHLFTQNEYLSMLKLELSGIESALESIESTLRFR